MLKLLTFQLIGLTGAAFLYAYISRHGLGKIHRIFSGLIVVGALTLIGVTAFCGNCGEGSCQGGNSENCVYHKKGNRGNCTPKSSGRCSRMGYTEWSTRDSNGDEVIEKEVIIKNGDTTITEIHH